MFARALLWTYAEEILSYPLPVSVGKWGVGIPVWVFYVLLIWFDLISDLYKFA